MNDSALLDLSASEALTTTRAVRRRLDFERPLEIATLIDCLRIAAQAPSGGGRDRARWIVVTDPARRADVANVYRRAGRAHLQDSAERAADARTARIYGGAVYLADNLHRAPAIVIACSKGRVDGIDNVTAAGFYGSILPAVWSFQIALRVHGLASCWTTVHLRREEEMAELLGIPEDFTQVALLPIAHSIGTDFKPARRRPVEEAVYIDRWGVTPHAPRREEDR